jgi:hypothetical protein
MSMPAPQRHTDLYLARAATLGPVVLAFPVATAAVFVFGAARDHTADVLSAVYSVGLFAAFTTSLWPLPSLAGWSRPRSGGSGARRTWTPSRGAGAAGRRGRPTRRRGRPSEPSQLDRGG